MERFIKEMVDAMESETTKNTICVKTHPMKKEWTKTHNQLIKETKAMQEHIDKLKLSRDKLWADIGYDLNETRGMKINSETNEIEVYEERKKSDSIPSPFGRI